MSKKLLLFSGGPDSTAAAYLLKGSHSDLHLLTLSDETKAKNIGELKAANKIAAMLSLPYKVVDVSALNAFLDGLPNILMSLGTGGMLEQSGFSFKFETPFLKWSKSKLMLEAMKLGAPMHLTFSCIIPGAEEPCGECAGCQERNKAIAEIEEIELMPEIAAIPTASSKESKVLAL